jgi:prevent-host-death family protein
LTDRVVCTYTCTYKGEVSVGSVSIRDLSRNTSKVVDDVSTSGRPAIVTKYGRAVAAVVPIDEIELEDFILASASQYVRSIREAEEDLRRGRTTEALGFLEDLDRTGGVDGSPRARSKGSARSGAAGRTSPKRRSTGARAARKRR